MQYEGVRQEHVAVRTGCGVFDVSHMGEIETSGPGALDLLQRLLSNDVAKIEVGGAQYSVLCRDDGGVLDDLFTYRLADDRYLTVTNASNHERDLGWFLEHAAAFDAEVTDSIADWAMLAVQGPRCPRDRRGGAWSGAAAADAHRPGRLRRGGGSRVRHRLHGRGRRRGPGAAGSGHRAVGRAGLPAARRRPGSARATRCASRCAFTSTATTCRSSATRSPAGLGWCCKEETGFIGVGGVAEARARAGRREKLAPFVADRARASRGRATR